MATPYAFEYDTRALRAAANRLKQCAQRLSNDAKPKIGKLRGEVDDNLEGRAAEVLMQRIIELDGDVSGTVNSLNNLAGTLLRYAADLERMARELRARMT